MSQRLIRTANNLHCGRSHQILSIKNRFASAPRIFVGAPSRKIAKAASFFVTQRAKFLLPSSQQGASSLFINISRNFASRFSEKMMEPICIVAWPALLTLPANCTNKTLEACET